MGEAEPDSPPKEVRNAQGPSSQDSKTAKGSVSSRKPMVRGTLKPKHTEVPVVETAFEELRWAWYQEVVAAREAEDPTFDSSKAPRKAPQEEVIEVPSNESFVDSKQKARDGGDDGLDTENLSKTMKDVKARASSDTEDLSEMVKIKRSETEVKKEDSVKLEKDAQPPEINEVTTSKSKELTDETPIVEVKSEASPSKIAEIPTAEVSTNLANSSRSDNETEVSAARIKEVCPISMDDGPKADPNPKKSDGVKPQEDVAKPQEDVAKPQEDVAKPQEDVAKPHVAFDLPQKTEMSTAEDVQKIDADPQVTNDVPRPKPVTSTSFEKSSTPTTVTAVGKKKVVWKNRGTDVASGVPIAKSKIVAKAPSIPDSGEGPSTVSSVSRKKLGWKKNQKTSETEAKNQEHQDTDVPSDTSPAPASKKVESEGRVRTPRDEEKVKPPVNVTVTDVDADPAPKSTERSRSKPSWRKVTKAEERKGRDESSPRTSPEKIEIKTSETIKPVVAPEAPAEAPAEPEPSRPLEEVTKETVLPEAEVTEVLSVPSAPSAPSRSASPESTTQVTPSPPPTTPSPSWRKMHISQYRDQRRRPGSTSPTRSRRTRSASARRERAGDSDGAASPRARWRGVPSTVVVQPGPGMEKKPRIKELRERNALIDAAINEQALRQKSHSVSHVWLRLHDMHKELHEKRSELVEKKRKEVEEQDLLIRLEYRPPRQAQISEVEAIASKLHGQKAEQEEKRKAALEEREKSLAQIYCFAPTLSPKTRELVPREVVGTHRISELYKDHQRRLQSKSQLSQQMEEKEQKSLAEHSVHKNVKNADVVHEASQKLFEDAQKRHQRLSERREQVLQRELQELQAMSIHKVGDLDGKIDFGDRLHEEAKRRDLRMMQKKEQAEEAAKALRTRALSSPGLLRPGQGFKLLYEDAARREKSLLERQKRQLEAELEELRPHGGLVFRRLPGSVSEDEMSRSPPKRIASESRNGSPCPASPASPASRGKHQDVDVARELSQTQTDPVQQRLVELQQIL